MIQVSPKPTDGFLTNFGDDQPEQIDLELHVRIQQALKSTGYKALRNIGVAAYEGHVRLNGRVPTYYLKQVAQTKVMSIEEVKTVKNAISVV